MKKKEKIAYIHGYSTDVGGFGKDVCSHCGYDVTEYTSKVIHNNLKKVADALRKGKKPSKLEEMICSGCRYMLKRGGPPYIPIGGSDF